MHCDNIDVHREASRAIANLYSSFGNHNAIIIRDGIPRLVHLAVSADLECQYHGALAFRKLAPNLDSHKRIIDAGGLQSLYTLIGVNDLKIQRQAATALRDLAANELFKIQFVDERWNRLML
jgi:hypothetical protein